jgi:hypothetical protein
VLLFSAGPVLPVYAVDVPTLYSAEVALDEDSDNPRDDAYEAALIEVLTRVSGSQFSANDEAIDELFPVPAAYVTQFRPGSEDTLWVSFDGEAIERLPQQSRSIDRNRMLRERVLEIAEKRGLPLAFPLLDTTDLQSVTFSDIWGGFDERIIDASRRYEAKSILIGRVRPSSSQRNRWTYVFGGETRTWSGPPEAIVSQIADTLAAEFAVGGNAPLEMVALNVAGIQTVDAYGSVQALLSGVSLIEGFQIAAVSGDVVSYQVKVRGGANRLRRALRFVGLLEQTDTGNFGDLEPVSALEFFYSP